MNGEEAGRAGSVLWLTADKPKTISVGRRRIADHLERRGFEVTLRGTTPRTLAAAFGRREEYDVFVGTTRAGAIGATVLKLATGTPLLVDHVDPIRQFEATNPWPLAVGVRTMEDVAFRVADHVCYVYEEEAPRVRRHAAAATKTSLGVEYDRFADPTPEAVSTARTRIRSQGVASKVAIYVGGLEPIYHLEELLEAMRYLDDWSLVVLGAGSLSSAVWAASTSRANVHYLGTVPHDAVPGYLHAADVGVCLVDDPHTLKVLEYAAAGLPVVQLRGRAEDRFDENAVVFCDPDPRDVARAIRHAERTADPTALRTFARRFDWEAIAESYAEVLRSLTRGRRPARFETGRPTGDR